MKKTKLINLFIFVLAAMGSLESQAMWAKAFRAKKPPRTTISKRSFGYAAMVGVAALLKDKAERLPEIKSSREMALQFENLDSPETRIDAFLWAVKVGEIDFAWDVLEAGLNVHANTCFPETPTVLDFVLAHNEINLARHLVEHYHADVNALSPKDPRYLQDSEALIFKYAWNPEILALLVKNGADLRIKDSFGRTILSLIFNNSDFGKTGYVDLIDWLYDRGIKIQDRDKEYIESKFIFIKRYGWLRFLDEAGLGSEIKPGERTEISWQRAGRTDNVKEMLWLPTRE